MPGIGHDGGRIGIDQHDLVAQFSQGLAGLGAGIVEFTGLADDDGTGTDDHNFWMSSRFGIKCSLEKGDMSRVIYGRKSGPLLL